MDRRVIAIGRSELFELRIAWESDAVAPGATAADATRGRLAVRIKGRSVWGSTHDRDDGFSWTWIELAEHLARYWAFLFVEEGDPLGLGVPPEALRAKAEEHWTSLPAERRAEEEERLWAYLESHDLASGVHGAYPSPLWFTREGNRMRVSCKDAVAFVPVTEARELLTSLGDAIVERVAALRDPRSLRAVATWKAREAVDSLQLAEIATGRKGDDIKALANAIAPISKLGFDAAFDPDEYLAVARMSADALPASELIELFRSVRAQPEVWTGAIDKLAEGAAPILADDAVPPFEQGRAVARWLREQLSIDEGQRVEPEEILGSWKIRVGDIRLSSNELDAVSVWGPKHGPAVIVNRAGRHGRMNGRRATLAHEIGHLVMDRRDALPVAEVLGGHVSNRVEVRARAFAAELLMPERVAGREVIESLDVPATVRKLSAWYGASKEIVAWQAYNAHDRRLPPNIRTILRSLVSRPEWF